MKQKNNNDLCQVEEKLLTMIDGGTNYISVKEDASNIVCQMFKNICDYFNNR